MSSPLSKRILERIEKERIRPRPRWWFVMYEALVWSMIALTGSIAGITIALSYYRLHAGDVFLMFTAGVPWYQLLLVIGWIGAFVCLFLLLLYEVRCTKRGYRFSLYAVGGAGALVIIGIAGLQYHAGVIHTAELHLARTMPATYYDAASARERFWSSPEGGRLMGYIVAQEGAVLEVRDADGSYWVVHLSNVPDIAPADTHDHPPRYGLFVGTQSGTTTFSACAMTVYEEEAQRRRSATGTPRAFRGDERLVGSMRTKRCAPMRITQ